MFSKLLGGGGGGGGGLLPSSFKVKENAIWAKTKLRDSIIVSEIQPGKSQI